MELLLDLLREACVIQLIMADHLGGCAVVCVFLRDTEDQHALSLGKERMAELSVRIPAGEHPRYPDRHDDMTHFNADGAKVIAGLVADWMRDTADLAHLIRTEKTR